MKTHLELEAAQALMLARIAPLGIEHVPPEDALGRTLATAIIAPLDQPPFDRSPLDGYAVRAADLVGASRARPARLAVVDTLYAGDVARVPIHAGQAVRIMTGAMLPAGCDCVLRQEDSDRGETTVALYTPLQAGENYIHRGEDFSAGALLLSAGTVLDAAALGALASAGFFAAIPVRRRPRVAVLCTGDELIDPAVHPLPAGKIYGANGALLLARLRELGVPTCAGRQLGDDPQLVADAIRAALAQADLVLTTGGVSEGAKDILHAALPLLGAEQIFWKVNVKPGTPALFSLVDGMPVLSLSGNPFAALATFELLARPLLAALADEAQLCPRRVSAVLESDIEKYGKLRRYLRGTYCDGRVHLPGRDAAGLLSSAVGCNCLVELLPQDRPLRAGESVTVLI